MKTERRQLKMGSMSTMLLTDARHRQSKVKILLVVAWIILLAALSHSLNGQTCTMACADRLEVPLGVDCDVRLVPNTVFTDGGIDCPGEKNLILNDDAIVVAQGIDSIVVELSAYAGMELALTVIDSTTDVSCTTILEIVDNRAPTLVCVDTTIACTADTAVVAIGMPTISDNCDAVLELSHIDSVAQSNACDSAGIRVITRTWTLVDGSGNSASCAQTIVVEQPDFADILFPAHVQLSCDMPDADPSITGAPLIDSLLLDTSVPCGLNISFQDDTTMTCGGLGMVIARTWLVLRNCDAMSVTHEQLIEIKDSVSPTIVCPAPFTVNTSVGDCTARLTLPLPQVTDNCDPNATFFVETSYGAMNMGPHNRVPVGTHSVTYTALDACGNFMNCTTSFEVVDNEIPAAICDDEVVVSLVDGGVAIARALSFDEGSRDNCADELFFKVVRTTTGSCMDLNGDDATGVAGVQEWFDDFVFFCCEDAENGSIPVQLRVFTVDPGEGPVDPQRMGPGGDLLDAYNQCDLLVTVQDQIRPDISCPASVTIDCRDDVSDLTVFGEPTVSQTCGYTLESSVVEDLDDCGTGVIYRTFTAVSNNELDASCTQVITIENQIALVADDITWPLDYEGNQCNEQVAVEDLPAGFSEPIIDYESCSLVAISNRDERYNISEGCFKVFRYWSVIDWCQFSESDEGRFDHRQVIKVQDEIAPTITCSNDIVVGLNTSSCNTSYVNIPAPTAFDDCSVRVDVTNNSPFAEAGGTDASGTYPLGTTKFFYQVSDRCGNASRCEMEVTVVDDRAPAPICIDGLVATLSSGPNNEISATVTADVILARIVNDGCHVEDEISVSIRRAVNNPAGPPLGQTSLTFACDDIGEQGIELWVTDENNNSDYCTTFVRVQDNSGVCPNNLETGTIAGTIVTEDGKEVENAHVEVMNDATMTTTTGVNGTFQVDDLPYGEKVTLVPRKNDDLMNGVSTMDMIIISKHILGLESIASPYSLIAADIDGSGSISTLDLIRLRKLVLNEADAFPNDTPSWRFIDADFTFPEGENPLKVDFPQLKDVETLNTATGAVRFIAIKMGDVNGTVRPNSILMSEGRTTNGDVVMRIQNKVFSAGETFTTTLYSEDLFNLVAFQFTLDYDERLIELVDFTPGDLPQMTRANFSEIDAEMGRFTTSWNEKNTVLTIDKGNVCTMTFRARRAGDLYTALALNSEPTVAEAYNYNAESMQILLQFVDDAGSPVQKNAYRLYQNYPNPFQEYTRIGFVMPKRGVATLEVYDLSGKLVYQHQGEFPQGYHELELSSTLLPAHGLYLYRLAAEDFSTSRKLIFSVGR